MFFENLTHLSVVVLLSGVLFEILLDEGFLLGVASVKTIEMPFLPHFDEVKNGLLIPTSGKVFEAITLDVFNDNILNLTTRATAITILARTFHTTNGKFLIFALVFDDNLTEDVTNVLHSAKVDDLLEDNVLAHK
jgi:hypothetical protein